MRLATPPGTPLRGARTPESLPCLANDIFAESAFEGGDFEVARRRKAGHQTDELFDFDWSRHGLRVYPLASSQGAPLPPAAPAVPSPRRGD